MNPYQGLSSERNPQEEKAKQGMEVHQAWSHYLGPKENEKGSDEEEDTACRRIVCFWEHKCFTFRWRIYWCQFKWVGWNLKKRLWWEL